MYLLAALIFATLVGLMSIGLFLENMIVGGIILSALAAVMVICGTILDIRDMR